MYYEESGDIKKKSERFILCCQCCIGSYLPQLVEVIKWNFHATQDSKVIRSSTCHVGQEENRGDNIYVVGPKIPVSEESWWELQAIVNFFSKTRLICWYFCIYSKSPYIPKVTIYFTTVLSWMSKIHSLTCWREYSFGSFNTASIMSIKSGTTYSAWYARKETSEIIYTLVNWSKTDTVNLTRFHFVYANTNDDSYRWQDGACVRRRREPRKTCITDDANWT